MTLPFLAETPTATPFSTFADATSVVPAGLVGGEHPDRYLQEVRALFADVERYITTGEVDDQHRSRFALGEQMGDICLINAGDYDSYSHNAEKAVTETMVHHLMPEEMPETVPHQQFVRRTPMGADNDYSEAITIYTPLRRSPVIKDQRGAEWQLARYETMGPVGMGSVGISAIRLTPSGK